MSDLVVVHSDPTSLDGPAMQATKDASESPTAVDDTIVSPDTPLLHPVWPLPFGLYPLGNSFFDRTFDELTRIASLPATRSEGGDAWGYTEKSVYVSDPSLLTPELAQAIGITF